MNTVVAGWETRNFRRSQRAALWCKNYGLVAITRTAYIGLLDVKEREELRKKFQNSFIKSTDSFYLLLLCNTCMPIAVLPEKVAKDIQRNQATFELITVKENV